MLTGRHRIKLFGSGPLACFLSQTAFGTVFTYLTSGMFLNGPVILMGVEDVLVSYLSVIVNIYGVLILLFSVFLERLQSRRRLTLAPMAPSKLAVLFIVMIPALLPERLRLVILTPAVITTLALQAQTTVVLNQQMLGFVDEKKSGRYISLRQIMAPSVTVVLSLTAGRFVDYMNEEYTGSVILFTSAAVMGVIELVLLVWTPDSAAGQTVGQSCKFGGIVKLPLKNRKSAGFVLYILLFYPLFYIPDSFTTVYLMKCLALPHQTMDILYMIISLSQTILLGIWGKISNRRDHHFVLTSSTWLFAGEMLFMSFALPKAWSLFIPIAFLISSMANAGFVIAVLNQWYELIPEENRIVYDSFYTTIISLGFILGPMVGGAIKHSLEESAFLTNAVSFAGIRLLYPVSTVGILPS